MVTDLENDDRKDAIMTRRQLYLATSIFMLPVVASAQPINGLYVGLGAGVDWHGDQRSVAGNTPSLSIALPGQPLNIIGQGGLGKASVGYGFGNGLRAELEGSYRQNPVVKNVTGPVYDGDERQYSAMINAYYDFDLGLFLKPFVGAGAGVTVITWKPVNRIFNFVGCCGYFGSPVDYGANKVDVTNLANDSGTSYSVQAMAGFSFPIAAVPGLSMSAEYRYFAAPHKVTFKNLLTIKPETGNGPTQVGWGSTTYSGHTDQSLVFGLTYAFDTARVAAPAAAAVPAPAPATIPAVQPARSYLVFFDWDKADLTARAKQIIAEAAQSSAKTNTTRIAVAGHADTSGTAGYNQGLSMKRAEAVAAELVKDGVARTAISISAFGSTKLLVPTAAGVREPQNRRVEIVLK